MKFTSRFLSWNIVQKKKASNSLALVMNLIQNDTKLDCLVSKKELIDFFSLIRCYYLLILDRQKKSLHCSCFIEINLTFLLKKIVFFKIRPLTLSIEDKEEEEEKSFTFYCMFLVTQNDNKQCFSFHILHPEITYIFTIFIDMMIKSRFTTSLKHD